MSDLSDTQLIDALAQRLAEPIARHIAAILSEQRDESAARWLDTGGAADYLGIGRDRLLKMAAAGTIPSQQETPNAKRFYRTEDLDRWREGGGAPARLRAV